ncbi:MAG: TrbI/VirB10 family protein [Candidatus Adiutrix sp.]
MKSPSFFESPEVKKTNKNILIVIVVVLAAMVAVLLMTMTSEKKETKDTGLTANIEETNKPLTAPLQGFGLVTQDQPPPPQSSGADATNNETTNLYVGPPKSDPVADAIRREQEEIRRRKFEREQQAFSSNLLVKRESRPAQTTTQAINNDPNFDRPYTPVGPDAYDPSADKDKEAFFARADSTQWISPHTRESGRKFELKTGSVIPGIMISGINSDLPGALIAQVSQNVYDTATGKFLLFPQGAKIYGVYDSRVVYGQSRVLVAWNRIIFPDGSSVTLGAMPGADMAGYAGFNDQVNNHYLRIFGSAIMMSMIVGGMAYAADQASNNNNNNNNNTSFQDEMMAALAAQVGQTTMQMIQKNLNIKPTLEIRPGYEFNIVVTKDVVFGGAYVGR